MDGHAWDDDLVAIMRRLAGGDEAAVVTLYERYRGPIAASVQRVAAQRGRRLGRDDVAGAVMDVCFEIASVAGAWSPEGGALPWVWARRRVANVVDRTLGQWTELLDEARLAALPGERATGAAPAAPADPAPQVAQPDGSMLDALARLAPDLASARLLAAALDAGGISTRDRELWLEYEFEKRSGNRSPAATVAPAFGMREGAVRQVVRRARRRLLGLAAGDERFAGLADLPVLA